MAKVNSYTINPGWRLLLSDLGLRPADVLRRAGLPDDLFGREKAALSIEEYFRLWHGIEEESADPTVPLRIGTTISVEAFDPPIFAALCSPDLNMALGQHLTANRGLDKLKALANGKDGSNLQFRTVLGKATIIV